jgi:hypothetical protein
MADELRTAGRTRENWPIAASMIQYPNVMPDGRSVQDQSAAQWAATLDEVADAGLMRLTLCQRWCLRSSDSKPNLSCKAKVI